MKHQTFRGRSLEEVMPRVREELGEQAVIVDRRETVEGGVGGFFGKRIVELEAAAPEPPAGVPEPPVDAAEPPAEPSVLAPPAEEPRPAPRPLADVTVGDLFDPSSQAPDFVALFEAAHHRVTAMPPAPAAQATVADPAPEPMPDAQPPLQPEPQVHAQPQPAAAAAAAPQPHAVAQDLVAAGMPPALAEDLMAEAHERAAVFGGELRAVARDVLVGRIPVAPLAPGRAMAIVGPGGSGKTTAATALGERHAQVGRALSIVDTEPVSPRDAAALTRLRERLSGGVQVHLAVSLFASPAVVEQLLDAFAPVDALLLTHADETDQLGAAIGVAIARRVPLSYVSHGPQGVRPADPAALAAALLPAPAAPEA
jgi:flagellar biosynthesis GTPase FlhF